MRPHATAARRRPWQTGHPLGLRPAIRVHLRQTSLSLVLPSDMGRVPTDCRGGSLTTPDKLGVDAAFPPYSSPSRPQRTGWRCRWTIYQLIWNNEEASVQVGRCRRIVRKSFEDYMARLVEESA